MDKEPVYAAEFFPDVRMTPQDVKNAEAEHNLRIAKELLRIQKSLEVSLLVKDNNLQNISGQYKSLTELLHNSEFISRLSQELYISDKDETTWFKLRLRNGKFVSVSFVMSFKLEWLKVYNNGCSGFDNLVVGYTPGVNVPATTAAIPRNKYTVEGILSCFPQLKGQTACDPKEVGKLLLYIISKRIADPSHASLEYVGDRQGFAKCIDGKIRFSPPSLLNKEIYAFLSSAVTSRQYPMCIEQRDGEDMTPILAPLFENQKKLQVMLLFRLANWHSSFFAKKDVCADNILIVKPSVEVPVALLVAILKNTRYDSLDASPIGPNIKSLKFDLESVNDGMVVAVDVYAADQVKKAEKGYDLLINDTSGASGNDEAVHHVTALISQYADLYIPKDKRCVLEFEDVRSFPPPDSFKNALRRLDADIIPRTENGCSKGTFSRVFNNYIDEIMDRMPRDLPRSKYFTYIMLMTALRIYNEWYSPLFSPDIEQYIEDWLSSQEQEIQPLYDVICSEYGKILNQKIAEGYYRLILKEETTPFDKGSHTIVVDKDERRIYVETADSFDIAKDEMTSIADTDSLTAALYSGGYLPHNAKDEKSIRIAAISSDGTPYPLYVHAISYKLLTQENKLRFDLLDKEANLFKYDEIPREGFLPLIKTIDGRFAGKMIRYAAEESNIYFGTGKTGSGKSWAIAQLICMLFMIGQIVVVFDVSGSYTKEKLMKMLPPEVVEKLFQFINIGASYGMDMIPVDLGSLRGCETLPDKKRAIYSVLRAAAGPIDKGTSRKLKGFLSDYLKDKEYSVSLNNLCSELEYAGDFGAEIADRIESVLDDINEVGFEEQTWDDLFLQGRKIIVINLGNEVGDSTHQLLDMMVGSLFNWQMSHDAGFLSIAIDELIDQDFSTGSPLQTLVKQGRKYHSALIGATQDYYNQGSSHLDVMKQANMKSFCRPGKSEDHVAQKLGYRDAFDAGFYKFSAGDEILEFDGYNKETDENEALIIKGRVVNFVETPLYEKFKELYGC